MNKTKQFRYLKPGDKVFVIDCGKPYVSEVVSISYTLGEFHPNKEEKFCSGVFKYTSVDELPEDIDYGDAKVKVTIKNHRYSDVDKEIDALFDESHPEKETWTFEDDALSTYYVYIDYIYVFCDIQGIQEFRDHEYDIVIKPWDNILKELKTTE